MDLKILKVSITKDKNQGCTIFGSCLIKGVTNKESPKWLKEKLSLLVKNQFQQL